MLALETIFPCWQLVSLLGCSCGGLSWIKSNLYSNLSLEFSKTIYWLCNWHSNYQLFVCGRDKSPHKVWALETMADPNQKDSINNHDGNSNPSGFYCHLHCDRLNTKIIYKAINFWAEISFATCLITVSFLTHDFSNVMKSYLKISNIII